MIRITPQISISEDELTATFIRSGGPGGQNVNKVSTAVELRFDVAASPSLPPDVKARLARLAGSALTNDGVLIIHARRHRSQLLNRQDALERLSDLIRRAAVKPKPRRATRPTAASNRRRLEHKKHRANIRRMRGTGDGRQ
jgi:ribosome-associated protein